VVDLSGNNWPQVSIAVLTKQTVCQLLKPSDANFVKKTTPINKTPPLLPVAGFYSEVI